MPSYGDHSHLLLLCDRMNEETRKLFSDLGSKNVKDLAFRDSWVFVGAKGVQNKSPFEQVRGGGEAGNSTSQPRAAGPGFLPASHEDPFCSRCSLP